MVDKYLIPNNYQVIDPRLSEPHLPIKFDYLNFAEATFYYEYHLAIIVRKSL